MLMLSGLDRKDPRQARVLSDESLGFPADGSARAILYWVLWSSNDLGNKGGPMYE